MTQFDPAFENDKKNWSRTSHGLMIAAQTRIVDAQRRAVAVAVRNTTAQTIQLVPGHPELLVQTLDGKGRVLQAEPVESVQQETTHPDGLLAPGATARYLITYAAPVLGAKQRLGVAVAQTAAADEPATLELAAGLR